MGTYLLVANRTLAGSALTAHLGRLIAKDAAAKFVVVVPVPPPPAVPFEFGGAMGGIGVLDVDTRFALAQEAHERLDALLTWFRAVGVPASGDVYVSDPLAAMESVAKSHTFDEIIISTLPSTLSRWLRLDITRRAERHFAVPVTTITGTDNDLGTDFEPVALSRTTPVREPVAPQRTTMGESVYKIIELVGTSTESWEKAAAAAVLTASQSLRDLRVAEVVQLDLVVGDGAVAAYRAKVKVSFKYQTGD